MRLPEWPCARCKEEHTAVYKGMCMECKKDLLGTALTVFLMGRDDIDPDDLQLLNPNEDYGGPGFRAFNGNFPKDIRRFGDPR